MVLFAGFIIRSWSVQPYTCTATIVILPDARELTLHLLVQTQSNEIKPDLSISQPATLHLSFCYSKLQHSISGMNLIHYLLKGKAV